MSKRGRDTAQLPAPVPGRGAGASGSTDVVVSACDGPTPKRAKPTPDAACATASAVAPATPAPAPASAPAVAPVLALAAAPADPLRGNSWGAVAGPWHPQPPPRDAPDAVYGCGADRYAVVPSDDARRNSVYAQRRAEHDSRAPHDLPRSWQLLASLANVYVDDDAAPHSARSTDPPTARTGGFGGGGGFDGDGDGFGAAFGDGFDDGFASDGFGGDGLGRIGFGGPNAPTPSVTRLPLRRTCYLSEVLVHLYLTDTAMRRDRPAPQCQQLPQTHDGGRHGDGGDGGGAMSAPAPAPAPAPAQAAVVANALALAMPTSDLVPVHELARAVHFGDRFDFRCSGVDVAAHASGNARAPALPLSSRSCDRRAAFAQAIPTFTVAYALPREVITPGDAYATTSSGTVVAAGVMSAVGVVVPTLDVPQAHAAVADAHAVARSALAQRLLDGADDRLLIANAECDQVLPFDVCDAPVQHYDDDTPTHTLENAVWRFVDPKRVAPASPAGQLLRASAADVVQRRSAAPAAFQYRVCIRRFAGVQTCHTPETVMSTAGVATTRDATCSADGAACFEDVDRLDVFPDQHIALVARYPSAAPSVATTARRRTAVVTTTSATAVTADASSRLIVRWLWCPPGGTVAAAAATRCPTGAPALNLDITRQRLAYAARDLLFRGVAQRLDAWRRRVLDTLCPAAPAPAPASGGDEAEADDDAVAASTQTAASTPLPVPQPVHQPVPLPVPPVCELVLEFVRVWPSHPHATH